MTKQYENPNAKTWDKMARKYNRTKISDIEGYERSIARAIKAFSKTDHILELGCGTGTTGLRYLPHVAQYTGTDISSEMIAICREKLAASEFSNAEFKVSEASELEFDSGKFDAVIAHNLFHLVEDVPETLSKAYRVLKPGGKLITKTPCLANMSVFIRKIAVPIMARIYGFKTLHMFTPEQLSALIAEAGFEITDTEYHASKGTDFRPFIIAVKAV